MAVAGVPPAGQALGPGGASPSFGSSLISGLTSALPIVGPVVSGIASLIGGGNQNSYNQQQVQQQENFQTQSIQAQENYQTQMSDTAYQRSVADMEQAGLNPALMYGSGGPESSPSGASASGASMQSAPNILGNAVQAGFGSANDIASMMNTIAQTSQSFAQTKKIQADTSGVNYSNQEKEFEGNLFALANKFMAPILTRVGSGAGSSSSGNGSNPITAFMQTGAGPSGSKTPWDPSYSLNDYFKEW